MRQWIDKKRWAWPVLAALLWATAGHAADRAVRALDMTVNRGETNKVIIALDAQGDENALGLSVCYNTNHLTFLRAVRTSAVLELGAALNVNALQTNQGRVGLGLGLNAGEVFPAGTLNIIEVSFRAVPGGGTVTTPVTLCDLPVGREIVDVTAILNLPAFYSNATVTVVGSCTYALATNATSIAASGGNGSVGVLADSGCPWTVLNASEWITITSATNGTGNATVSFTAAGHTNPSPRSAVLTIAGQTFSVNQAGYTCPYEVSPVARTHGPGMATNTFTLSTDPGCAWNIENTNAWIAITSAASGTGSSTNIYVVEANPNLAQRVGILRVAGQSLTITQQAFVCSYSLSPDSRMHGPAGTSNFVSVTAAAGCAWNASTTNSWITLATAPGGLGNGVVGYLIAANPDAVERVGSIQIEDQFLVLTQRAAGCTVTLAAPSASHGAAANTGSFGVLSAGGCDWTAATTNNWITLTSGASGNGNGTISYSIETNTSASARAGHITVTGPSNTVTFNVSQEGTAQCEYSLSPTNRNHGYGAATNTTSLTTSNACAWTVVNTNAWITIESAASGAGSATIAYSVAANPVPVARTGVVVIAGLQLTISQDAVACAYSLSARSRMHGPGGTSNFVSVTTAAACAWTASTTNPWITLATATGGLGNGVVGYLIAANPDAVERVGAIQIEDQFLVLTQRAASCTVALSAPSASHGAATGAGALGVLSAGGCGWAAATTNDWITITSGASGSGNGSVGYTIQTNAAASARAGFVTVTGPSNTVTFTINQDGSGACEYALSPTNRNHGYGAATNSTTLTTSNGCAWTVVNSNAWITIESASSGTGSATITYSVAANPVSVARTGVVVIAGLQLTISQDAAACAYALAPGSPTHGAGAATNTVNLTTASGCPWNIVNTNSWITFTSPASGTGSATLGYTITANPVPLWRTGLVQIADQVFTIQQRPFVCSYSLSPKSRPHGFGASSNFVTVTTTAECAWTASTTNSWITLATAPGGAGNGLVGYLIAANPDAVERVGSIQIEDQFLVLTQRAAHCTVALPATSGNHGASAGTGSFNVTSAGGCGWTAATTNSWITILSGASGSGNGSVGYSIQANPGVSARAGHVTVTGPSNTVTFTVNQDGTPVACPYALSPTNRNHGYGAATNTTTLTTSNGCAWTVVNSNAWITIQSASSGTGTATLTYSVAANPSPVARTGVVIIAGLPFTVSQDAVVCSYTLSPRSRMHGPAGTSNTVDVTAAAGCAWSASTTSSWITVATATSGMGNGFVGYLVAANLDTVERVGSIEVAGEFLVLTQRAATCTVAVSPASASHGTSADTGSFDLSTANGCAWTAENTNAWITLTSPGSGSGNGTMGYSIEANLSGAARSGVIRVSGVTNAVNFTVTQSGQACTFTLAPGSGSHASGAGTGVVSVTTLAGCAWAVLNTNLWIDVTSPTNNSGGGQVLYSLEGNPLMTARTGLVVIAGQNFPVVQAGFTCAYALSPTNRNHGHGAATNFTSLTTSNDCAWSVENNNAWITIESAVSGTGSAAITYSVAANSNPVARTGVVEVAGQTLTIRQDAVACSYSLSPKSRPHGPGGTSNFVSVSAAAGCAWNASSTSSWITVATAASGMGNGVVGYLVAANPDAVERVGSLQVEDQFLVLTQQAASCTVALAPASTNHAPGADNGTFNVNVAGGCGWTAATTNGWITITSGASGTGNGAVSYDIQANATAEARAGHVTVTGPSNAVTFTIEQEAVLVACAYRISPTNRMHGAGAASNSIALTVSNGCEWFVLNTNAWVTILSATSGAGPATISYAVAANPSTNGRVGLVQIANQTLTLVQSGVVCEYGISPTNRIHGHAGAAGTVALTAPAACAWAVVNSNSWIQITSPASGAGDATISYTVEANTAPMQRTGLVFIADQILVLEQRAAPCLFELTPTNRLHGFGAETGLVAVTTSPTCEWTAATTNSWITITTAGSGTGPGSFGYSIATNPAAMNRTGFITVADETFRVVQSGAACSFAIAPSSRAHGGGAETNTVAVTTLAGCAWTVDNTNSWIDIQSGTNGSGPEIVTYKVDPNPSLSPRTGTLVIAGEGFLVTQAGFTCVFRLSPTNRNHGYGASTGLVTVTTSNGCNWTVENTNSWIAITTATSGSGSGSVGYAVEENMEPVERTGLVRLLGQDGPPQVFTLRQLAAACTVELSPAERTHGHAGATNTATIATASGCAWSAATPDEWITILSATNGLGSNVLTYAITPNPAMFERTGAVLVADQVLTVRQLGMPCSYDLSATSRTHGHAAATNTVSVLTAMGCPWTLDNTNAWIAFAGSTNGAGGATLTYTVAANPVTYSRTGIVVIAGISFTLRQNPAPCMFALTPTNSAHGTAAATGLVAIATAENCPWTIVNTSAWLTVTTAAGGTGNGSFGYAVEENTSPLARSAVILVGDEPFRVTQAGVPCVFTLAPTNATHGASPETNSVDVTTLAGCAWTVSNSNSWINILSGSGSNGPGTVVYSVDANPTIQPRAGLVLIAGREFAVSQAGAACTWRLSPTNRAHGHGLATGTVSIITLAGCDWDVTSTNDWITITTAVNGTGPATLTYTVAANTNPAPRTALVQVADQFLTLTQQAAPCAYSVSPLARTQGNGTVTNSITIATLAGCAWEATTTNDWITFLSPALGSGNGTVLYQVLTNLSTAWRTGHVMVADQLVTLAQRPTPCTYLLSPSNAVHGAGIEAGLVSVTAPAACAWSVDNTNSWINLLTGTNGSGAGSFEYEVDANPAVTARTGLVFVADQVLAIEQAGLACTFAIAPASRAHGAGMETGSVTVATLTGCDWTVEGTNDWISIASGAAGSSNGFVTYVVAANPDALARGGVLTVAGRLFTVSQAAAACTFALTPEGRSHGAGAETGAVAVATLTGCAWSAATTNSWITITAGASGSNSGSFTYTITANPVAVPRTGHIVADGQTFIVSQAGAACAFTIAPTGRSHGAGVETGLVTVTTLTGCAWTAASSNHWITIHTGATGSGDGTAGYSVSSNTTALARTGLVSVAGQTFTITQSGAACSFALTPPGRTHSAGAETGTVSVASLVGCAWSVENTNLWITITAGASGSGNGSATYAVEVNPDSTARSGTFTINGQPFTVTQLGMTCTYSIAPASWTHGPAGGTGMVTVTTLAGCDWIVSNTNSWITITSGTGGEGGGSLGYIVAAHAGVTDRTGVMTVAGQNFTVRQLGSGCAYRISPTNRFHGSGANINTVAMTASNGCAWIVANPNSWITILSNASGSGNAVIGYAITNNRTATPRAGVLNIGGELLTITQWGTNCGLALTPSSRAHGFGSETGLVAINVSSTNCAWSLVNTNPWLTINTALSGSGNGSFGYTVASNMTTIPRSGVVTADGESFTVTQAGRPCTYAIAPADRTHGSGAETGSVGVTSLAGCAWSVVNNLPWVTLTSGAGGNGSDVVNYSLEPNPTGLPRSGFLLVAGQTFSITQSGAPCLVTLSPTNRSHGAGAETGLVALAVITGCSWTADNTNNWITLTAATSGTGTGTVAYALSANPSSIPRTGMLTVGGQPFTVTQAGQPCTFAINPSSRPHGAGQETGAVAVTSVPGCAWNVLNTNTWMTLLSSTNGTGSGTVTYLVAANASTFSRTGLLHIAGQTFAITQTGANCTFTLVPASRLHGSGPETGSVGVATLAGCTWAVVNTNPWVTITAGSGTGSGTADYALAINTNPSPRSGLLTIGGQNFTITQAGLVCAYALNPAGRAHGPAPATGAITVTANDGCPWTATTTNNWVTLTSGADGSGNGTLNYSLLTNSGPPRAAHIVINGQTFTVSQDSPLRLLRALPMTIVPGETNKVLVALDSLGNENGLGFNLRYPTGLLSFVRAVRGAEAVAASATLNVNSASTNAGRLGFAIALNSDEAFPAGSNTLVEISFRAHPSAVPGVTAVTFTNIPVIPEVVDAAANPLPVTYVDAVVTVSGSCAYALASNAVALTHMGGFASVAVTAGTGCPWATLNTNAWLSVIEGAAGSGIGAVAFAAAPNPVTAARSGVLLIAGLPCTVTQGGVPCSYVLTPALQAHGSGAETGSATLTTLAGCPWSVGNPNGWIAITSAASGSGSASLGYTVAANSSSVGRTGLVSLAGQSLTVIQAGAPCAFALNPPGRAHGFATETGLVTVTAVTGCGWSAATDDSWITLTAGTSGTANGSVGYRAAFNPFATGRTGIVNIAGQTYTVTQPGNPCFVTLAPGSRAHTSGMETGQVSVVASNGCTWNVSNTNSWLTVTSSTNGTGNGNVIYTVAANPLGAARAGNILIGGIPFTASQAGAACVFAIAPMERAHTHFSESNVISVATFAGCGWSVRNTNNWITITSPTNLSGSGAVNYTVGANPSGFARTGIVMIADQPFTVTQAGAPCTFFLSPSSRHHGFGAETGSVSLATVFGCAWNVVNSNHWITLLSETNGTGPWGVTYSVAPNPAGLPRTGTVAVAGQTLTLSQAAAPCAYALSPTNRTHGHGAITSTVSVTTLVGCLWSVANTNSWISILSPADHSGPGAVLYALEENTTAFARTGTVTVAGQRLTLAQAGAPCTYALSPTNRAHGYDSSTNTIELTSVTGCPWTISNTNGWINILSAFSESGSATLTYSVSSNGSAFPRSGTLTIAGQTVTLAQDGAPCMFLIMPETALHTATAQTGLVNVLTAEGCFWSVNNTNPWITISTSTNGFGNGSFGYLVSSNSSPEPRTGLLQIAGQTFGIDQSGFVCSFALSPTSGSLTAGNVTGLVSVTTSPLCAWVVVNTNAWISIKSGESGAGPGLIRYTAAANPNPSLRTGTLVIGGVPFTVTQLGSPCIYSLSPTSRLHASGQETNSFTILTSFECAWTATSTNPWITFLSLTNGMGNAIVSYFVEPNPSALDRTGRVAVAGQLYTLTQLGAACTYDFATNEAAYGPAPATGSVLVVSTIGCPWSVVNTNSWVTLTSGATGSNTTLLNYSLAVNATPADRTGHLRVGASLYSITQTGIVCTFTLSATNFAHGSGSETGQVSVLTSNLCPWSVLNTNSWITLLSPPAPTGPAIVTYAVAANPTPFLRSGTLTIAGQTYHVTQAGFICAFTVNPASRTHSFGAVTGLVSVTTSNGCTWTLQSTNPWITFLGSTNRTGSGFVSYVAALNPGFTTRTGVLSIAERPFTLTQFGMPFLAASNKTVPCGTPWTFDPPQASGTCADTNLILTVLTTITNATCGSAYTATRRWDAQDTCGNRLTITQAVHVTLTAPPVANCAPFKTVECGTPWLFDAPTATDACGGLGVTVQVLSTLTNAGGGCGGAFSATRTWRLTDGCSNTTTCSQTVQALDMAPPALTCAPNKSVECGAAWDFDPPLVHDACGGTNATLRILSTTTNFSGLCGTTYTATRLWEAADACSNTALCSQTVTVVDTTPPALTCPPARTVECGQPWAFDLPVAVDTCGGTNVTLRVVSTLTNAAGPCGGAFSAVRTWEALDLCGNRATCSQTILGLDTTPPVLACPAAWRVELGAPWAFQPPTATDACGGAVSILVLGTVTNTADGCTGTYSVTRTWQAVDACSNLSATCSQTVQFVDTTPPLLTCVPNKMVVCGAGWAFDAPTASDAVSGTNVTVVVLSTVTNGSCAGGFTVTRTWQALDGCGNASALCSQTVSAATQAAIAGMVSYHPTNYPPGAPSAKRLSPVGVLVGGSTNLLATSSADGSYTATVAPGGSFTLTPRLTNSAPVANGVSTIDISLIRRHVLNIAALDTPYKLLAADVNGSRSVTTLDLTFMRRMILGSTNTLPQGLWRFVPSDYAFTNMIAPWDAPTNRTLPNVVASVSNQDFLGIKLGDVNNSWAPPVAFGGFAPAAQGDGEMVFAPEVSFAVSGHTNQPGEVVGVRVMAGSFREVTSAQGTLAWDAGALRFLGTGEYGLAGLSEANFGTALAGSGQLTFSWDDPEARGVTAADGTAVFTVHFAVIGTPGTVSPVALTSGAAEAEVGVNFKAARLRTAGGQVSIVAASGAAPAPQLTRAVHTNGVFGVPQQTVAGKRYVLEYTDSLPTTNWTALPAVVGDGSVMILADPTADKPQRFYRLRIE